MPIIEGTGNADVLVGGSESEVLLGLAGDDQLIGGEGSDRLDGGAGADVIDGGDGFDYLEFLTATEGIALSLATGGTGGDAAGDTYTSIEYLWAPISTTSWKATMPPTRSLRARVTM